jgi:NAD+ kinase
VRPARAATVFTHTRPRETGEALAALIDAAQVAGVQLRMDPAELEKHNLEPGGVVTQGSGSDELPDVALVLGGDGTILTALRRYAGTGVPVFAVNFGEIGFLSTIEPGEVEEGFSRAFAGDFEVLDLPSLSVEDSDGPEHAINDVSLHRKPGGRVADLSYAVGGEELGRVRSDGLVIATPAGSTGYNLANGGPLLAWGVEGFVVSFIAPHSLTARPLVVAPTDVLTVENNSREEPVDVSGDGRPLFELGPGEKLEASFHPAQGRLAQSPSSNFYHRLRDKFGRLSV